MSDEALVRGPGVLRQLTSARVSLATAGSAIATAEVLAFQLAHAQARDAVHAGLHAASFIRRLQDELHIAALPLHSNAKTRAAYLRQPGLGRTLAAESATMLRRGEYDLAIIVADGLSAFAVERNAIPLLASLLPLLASWRLAPLTVVEQARVAISDSIGEALGAQCSLILIGERPGLSAADSLGAYLTWNPRAGNTDAARNCISNIRTAGLEPKAAAARLAWYLQQARAIGSSGTLLKEGSKQAQLAESTEPEA